jgi:cytochrome b6-f complex iron-sulfur subunit
MQLAKPKTLTRGQFLSVAWLSATAVLVGETLFGLLKYAKPVAGGGFGGLVYAGKIGEFPPGSVNHILGGRFYIAHVEGGLIALWQRCTHLGCAVPWAENEKQFHCPCHGSLFDPAGLVKGGPAPRPLDMFPIVIKGDEVWVDTGKPVERSGFDPSQLTPV